VRCTPSAKCNCNWHCCRDRGPECLSLASRGSRWGRSHAKRPQRTLARASPQRAREGSVSQRDLSRRAGLLDSGNCPAEHAGWPLCLPMLKRAVGRPNIDAVVTRKRQLKKISRLQLLTSRLFPGCGQRLPARSSAVFHSDSLCCSAPVGFMFQVRKAPRSENSWQRFVQEVGPTPYPSPSVAETSSSGLARPNAFLFASSAAFGNRQLSEHLTCKWTAGEQKRSQSTHLDKFPELMQR
jgi:hypothetical protein